MATKIKGTQLESGLGPLDVVTLDASARLPAVDASLLTNLSALVDLVEDTTPQLGGTLDPNGNNIIGVNSANPAHLTIQAAGVLTGANSSGNLALNGGTVTAAATTLFAGNATLNGGSNVQTVGAIYGGSATVSGGLATQSTGGRGGNATIAGGDGGFGGGSVYLQVGRDITDQSSNGAVYISANGNGVVPELRFNEDDANGAQYVGLRAPAAITTNRIWTLPDTAPVDGYVLQTDASGNLSFVAPAGGSQTPWTSNIDAAGYSLITTDTLDDVTPNAITIKAGDNNYSVKGIGGHTGGNIDITAGNALGYYNAPGVVNITGGSTNQFVYSGGPLAGDVNLTGGNTSYAYGYAGNINLTGGAGTDGYGGKINLVAGTSVKDGSYSTINLTAGSATTTGSDINLTTGNGATPGVVNVTAGDGTTGARIRLKTSTNDYVDLKAPDAMAGGIPRTFTFPDTVVAGQFLTTDASGNMSWAEPTSEVTNPMTSKLNTGGYHIQGPANPNVGGNPANAALRIGTNVNAGSLNYGSGDIPEGFGTAGDEDLGLDFISSLTKRGMNFVAPGNADIRAHARAFQIFGGGASAVSSLKGVLEIFAAGTGAKSTFTDKVTLEAGATTSGTVAFALPSTSGNADEVMVTDGTGILSFADLKHIAINAQAGTTYTLVLADDNKLVTMNNAAANTLTIPTNTSVAFPIGTQILVSQEGAGITTIAGPGVTLHSANGFLSLANQYSTLTLIKKQTDTWLISGDLA